MVNNKIFDWLRDFDENYLKNFRDFVDSPYFNSNKKVKLLFEIIYSTKPEFTGKKLEAKNLLAKLFPGKEKSSEQSLKNLFSEISGLIKQFISHNGFKRNEQAQENFYADELFYISKYKEGIKHSENILAKLKKEEIFSAQYFDSYMKNISNLGKFFLLEDKTFETSELSSKNYEIFILKFIYDFVGMKNESAVYDNSQTSVTVEDFIKTFEKSINLKDIIAGLKKHNPANADILDIYYNIYSLLDGDINPELFTTTKEQLYQNFDKISYEEKYFLYSILVNYVYTRLGIEDIKYFREAFEISKFFLERDVFRYPGSPYMMNINYENIYASSTFAGDLQWSENFLNTYRQYLKPEHKDKSYYRKMSSLMLRLKRYGEALNHINSYKADDAYEKLDVKMYIIIIFYEEGDLERALYEYDTLIHYFDYHEKNFPKYVETILKNMMSPLKKVLFARANNKKLDYSDYAKFKDAPDILHKRWLLKKMEELL